MPFRYLWLAVSSDDARFKAFNFLKLIKPPDGEDMTDLNIKLDWNKDTANKWLVNDAKVSMSLAGYDWVERVPGKVDVTNFKVVFGTAGPGNLGEPPHEAGDPVTNFELLEEWMGPALAPGDPFAQREGVFTVSQPVGSTYDKWPVNGTGEALNDIPWETVMVQPPLSDSPYWFRTMVQKVNDTAAASNKVSLNGNDDSVWFQWETAQDPDLGPGEVIRLFKENANGDPYPIRERMGFAV